MICVNIFSRLIQLKLVTSLSSTLSPGQTLVSPATPLRSSTSSAGSGVYTPTKTKSLSPYTAGGWGGACERVAAGGRGGSCERVAAGGRDGSCERVAAGGVGGSCERITGGGRGHVRGLLEVGVVM